VKQLVRLLCGPFFVLAGIRHFTHTRWYVRIMPPYLPAHRELVYASGVAEALGGAGLMLQRTRRPAGFWLLATLVAVFPANLHMALHPEHCPKVPGGRPLLIARLPFQLVFAAWVLAAMRAGTDEA
jgi:uncharacterized membrane protein